MQDKDVNQEAHVYPCGEGGAFSDHADRCRMVVSRDRMRREAS